MDDDMKGGSYGLFDDVFPEFAWKYLEKLYKRQ
jgi:hypothetical protein